MNAFAASANIVEMLGRSVALLLAVAACGRLRFDSQPTGDGAIGDASSVAIDTCGDTSGLQAGAPWPIIHGCPTNSGRSHAIGPASGATAITPRGMTSETRGAIVAAANEILVEEEFTGDVYAYDGAGGQPWTFIPASGTGIEPFVAVDNAGVAYELTNYGLIFAFDVASGGEKWRLQQAGAFSAPVIAGPGELYFGANAPYGFYAIDTVAGALKWHVDVPNSGDAITAPAIANGVVYFVDTHNSVLYGLDDAAMGAIVLAVPIPGAVGSPVVAGGIIYVATTADGIAAVDATAGQPLWQRPPGESVVQPALLASGDVVSSTQAGLAFVLDRVSGDERATWQLGGVPTWPARIDADDTVYFATDQGTFAFAPTGGAPKWQSALTGSISIADHGLVVLPAAQIVAMIGP